MENFSAFPADGPPGARPTLKVAYFGLPLGAWLLLRDGHRLDPVVLSPIEAPGRRRLRSRGIAFLDALGSELTVEEQLVLADGRLRAAAPDLLVSWFWTRKLPKEFLELPRLGAIGVHPSLLPRHRGPNPYFWAIDSGDATTGATLHRLAEEYDTGALLAAREIPIGEKNAWQLARALDRPALALLREGVSALSRGQALAERAQDPSRVTWAPEPDGPELRVDFRWPTERVLRRIRALSPTPGLALELFGVRFFVTAAAPTGDYVAALEPGEASLHGSLVLRTGDGAVEVTRAFVPDAEDEAGEGETLDAAALADFLRDAGG